MPISILPQDKDGQELFYAISSFSHAFEIGKLLRKCNAQKEKGNWISLNTSCAMSFLIAACICSRKQVPSGRHFKEYILQIPE